MQARALENIVGVGILKGIQIISGPSVVLISLFLWWNLIYKNHFRTKVPSRKRALLKKPSY